MVSEQPGEGVLLSERPVLGTLSDNETSHLAKAQTLSVNKRLFTHSGSVDRIG